MMYLLYERQVGQGTTDTQLHALNQDSPAATELQAAETTHFSCMHTTEQIQVQCSPSR